MGSIAGNSESEYVRAQTMAHTSKLPRPDPWSVSAVLAEMNPPATEAFAEGSTTPIPFFHYLERLKIEKREGWRRFGINEGESISDHMYRMSLITMFAPAALASKLDIPRCTKMALIHDMAEGLVGDITPVDGVAKPEKSRREADTMTWASTSLLSRFRDGVPGQEMRAIWQEYEDAETAESKFVHDVDKIELLLQMVEYERKYRCEIDLSEFSWVAKKVKLPEMQQWAVDIMAERDQLWRQYHKEPRVDPSWAEHVKKMQEAYYDNAKPKSETGIQTNGTTS